MTASNALVPHLALALATGGYVPGLVSAALLTLPAGAYVLARAVRERWLSGKEWAGVVLLGIALLPLVTFSLLSSNGDRCRAWRASRATSP